ncbi:hypothetical protein C6P46_000106 [Rhodotorula mucilaginosa]|uniref:DNA (cytosine-5-)-methyltransferase n=1 Tax=Rhodotorula mucilaginosa TaxID=5537 RepID=A0A9P7BA95_RHOMI|nr:hypothetical protein C6P46_000106 [Rhodotorula mucilaginosa]
MNQHGPAKAKGKGKARETDSDNDDAERWPGLTALESDEYQRMLLETFHEAAHKAGARPDHYLTDGLQGLFDVVQKPQMDKRPEVGQQWPPDMRKAEQRIGYLGSLGQYLNPANRTGRYLVESEVPKSPWSTEPAMGLTGFGRTNDVLDLCDSNSDDEDDHNELHDRRFYLDLFHARLSPLGLQQLKQGIYEDLDEIPDAEDTDDEDDLPMACTRAEIFNETHDRNGKQPEKPAELESPRAEIFDEYFAAGDEQSPSFRRAASYGGGFEHDWNQFSEDVRDLGIGTSKNPPPPPPLPPTPPTPTPPPPVERPAKRTQPPLPTLEKLALVTDDEETAPGTGSRKTKRKKRTVYKPRTNFTNAIRKVRAPNRFSEDRLDERFPLDVSNSISAQKARRRRPKQDDDDSADESEEDAEVAAGAAKNGAFRDYTLGSFRALRTKRETVGNTINTKISATPIDLLEVILRDHTDFVVIGLASPLADDADDEDPVGEESMLREPSASAINHRKDPNDTTELEVYLYGHEVRSTRLTLFGIVLETASRRFHFTTPACHVFESSLGAGTPYEPHVVRARRLLNLYAFARAHAIRGDYLQPSAEEAERAEAVEDVATVVINTLNVVEDDDAWQSTLPFSWRLDRPAIRFEDGKDKFALFRLLPNIPFVVPALYRHIEPFFPANSFRTDEPERQQAQARDCLRAEKVLLDGHRRTVKEDEATDDLGHVVPWGVGVPKRIPVADQDDKTYQQRVKVYKSAKINGVRYGPGDVVLLRSAPSPTKGNARIDPPGANGRRRAALGADEDSSSGSETSETDLWYGLVKYFYEQDDEDADLQVHVVCFTASSILSKVQVTFPAVGQAPPSRGMYCMFAYNEMDGSFATLPVAASPAPRCKKLDVVPCSACENSIRYYETTTPDDSGKEPRPAKAVYDAEDTKGPMFSLHGVDYHELDTVYLLPRDLANITPPALPPYELAQLIARDGNLSHEKDELYVRVRRILRVQSSSLGSEREVKLTADEISVPAVDIADKFSLLVYSAKPSQEQVGRLEASSPHAFWTLGRDVPLCRKCLSDFDAQQGARAQAAALASTVEMHHLALYSGGGLLDIGLERGCPLLRIKYAVEQHAPAAQCHSANILESFSTIVNSVSNAAEAVYFGEETDLPQPGSLFSLAGGSPCQGFSHANRYKKTDDTRTFEPFVFLNFVALYRPLHVVFENVAAFTRHALPQPGSERGSFFKLFVSVLLSLGYQVRWQIVDAAGFGVPQSRRRVIVQAAARGVPLPKAPKPTHSLLRSVQPFDHRTTEGQAQGPLDKEIERWAPHSAVTVKDAFSDLPAFTVEQDRDEGMYGISSNSAAPPKYPGDPRSTFQRQIRSFFPTNPNAKVCHSGGVMLHVCRPTSEVVRTRLKKLQLRDDAKGTGCHNDLRGYACYPVPPPWVARKPAKLLSWWRRLLPSSVLAPLRTKLNIDGASHGERIHYSQNRPLSCRELLRAQGAPDFYELLFSGEVGEEAFDEWLRVIGNGVPVPLAAAYGDALFESLLPLVKEKPRNDVWAELWEETGGNALRAQKAPDEDGSPARESQEAAAASLSLQRRHAARTTTSSSSSSSSSSGHSSVLTTVTTPLLTSSGPTNENGAQVKAEEEEDQGGAESSDSDIEIVSGPGVARSTPDAQNRRARAPPTRYGVLELSSDSD